MASDSFGTKLRWRRIRAGVSLDQISAHTKVPVDVWAAMEDDDVAAWPTGIYARAYVRDYANLCGLDADAIVDDFCRAFPHKGDRRRDRIVRGQADIVGHQLSIVDSTLPEGVAEDRRTQEAGPNARASRRSSIDMRVAAAILDQCAVLALVAAASLAVRGHFWMLLAIVSLTYYGASIAASGCSAAVWAFRAYATRHGRPSTQADEVFPTLPRARAPQHRVH
jgi:hypothetical protein